MNAVLNNLRFGDKVQNQPVGRSQGFTGKGQSNKKKRVKKEVFTGAGRLSNLLEGITLAGGGGILVLKKRKQEAMAIGHLFDVIISLCYMFPWGTKCF